MLKFFFFFFFWPCITACGIFSSLTRDRTLTSCSCRQGNSYTKILNTESTPLSFLYQNSRSFEKQESILLRCLCVYIVTHSCPILCNPTDCSPPDFSVHGILQARILEWIIIPFSRGSSQTRDRTLVSCIAGRFFTI